MCITEKRFSVATFRRQLRRKKYDKKLNAVILSIYYQNLIVKISYPEFLLGCYLHTWTQT